MNSHSSTHRGCVQNTCQGHSYQASSWLCACLHNNVRSTKLLTTFITPECHFANLVRPWRSTRMQSRGAKSTCMRTLQVFMYSGSKFCVDWQYQCSDIFDLRSNSIGKPGKVIPWPELPSEADDGGVPRTLPSSQTADQSAQGCDVIFGNPLL